MLLFEILKRKHVMKLIRLFLISTIFLMAGCINNKDKKIMIGETCWIDGINGSIEPLVSILQYPIVFDGWAINKLLQKAPSSVVIQLSNEMGLIETTIFSDEMLQRHDISKVFGNQAYINSGFKVLMSDLNKIPKGEYTISLILNNEKTSMFCKVKNRILLN